MLLQLQNSEKLYGRKNGDIARNLRLGCLNAIWVKNEKSERKTFGFLAGIAGLEPAKCKSQSLVP